MRAKIIRQQEFRFGFFLFALLLLAPSFQRPTLAADTAAAATSQAYAFPLSLEEFTTLATELAPKVNLFHDAWAQDPQAEFFGGTSRDFLFWLKGKFQGIHARDSALKIMSELRSLKVIDIRDFIIGDSDIDIVSRKAVSLDASKYGVKKIDTIDGQRFSPDTEMGQNEIKQGYIPLEKIRLGRDGFIPWEGFGDGLKELYEGRPTVHYPDPKAFADTHYAKLKLNHTILLAARYLRILAINYFREHGREAPDPKKLFGAIDPASEKETEKIIDNALKGNELSEHLKQDRFVRWMNGASQKAFRSYTNPTATFQLFKHFKLDQLISRYGDVLEPINQYLFAKARNPDEIRAHLQQYGTNESKLYANIKQHFPDQTLYHGTRNEGSFRAILLQGILPSEFGSAGQGLYGVGAANVDFAIRWGGDRQRVVIFRLKDDAKLIDVTQGEGKRVYEAARMNEDEFAEYFGADILAYHYEPQAYVVKNSVALERPRGYTRQILTVSKAMEMATELKRGGVEAQDLFIRSLELSHFSTEETEAILNEMGDISVWLDQHIKAKDRDAFLARAVLSQEKWADPKRIGQMIDEKRELLSLAMNVFTQPFSKDWTELYRRLIQNSDEWTLKQIFLEPRLASRGEADQLIKVLMKKSTNIHTDEYIADLIMSDVWMKKKETPDLIRELIKITRSHQGEGSKIAYWLSMPRWAEHPEGISLLKALADNPRVPIQIFNSVLKESHWIKQPGADQLLESLISKDRYAAVDWILSRPTDWDHHPALPKFAELIIKGEAKKKIFPAPYIYDLFRRPEWSSQPQLKALCGGHLAGPECLREAFERGFTFFTGENCKAGILQAVQGHNKKTPGI